MSKCDLPYIPLELHSDGKPLIKEFAIGDIVYRRCKEEELENPFAGISLTELSHNLGTNKTAKISEKTDVLYSIKAEDDFETYTLEVCTLKIISLNPANVYSKPFEENKGGVKHIAEIEFLHDPVSCMYPHCIFRIWLNGEIVTHENYN